MKGMNAAERRDFLLYQIVRSLPVGAGSRFGAALGQIMGRRAHPAADTRIVKALTQLRPDLAAASATLEATQVRFWAHVGRIYAEYCVLDKILPQGRVTIDDPGTLDAVLMDGRPIIAPFVHLGNWETCGTLLTLRAPNRVCALSNPPPANRVQAQIAAMQHARLPGKMLAFDSQAWRGALRHLEQGGNILFVAIDEQLKGRVSLPSFGRALDPHANVYKIVRLAARVGAIILPVYSERIAGATFCMHVLGAIEVPRRDKLTHPEQLAPVAQLDAMFSAAVLRLIDQWFGLLDFHRQSLAADPVTRAASA